jgi:hypothetical protein
MVVILLARVNLPLKGILSMHTIIVVGGGFSLLVASLLLGHAWGNGMSGLLTGAKIFIPVWIICSALNMWIGVQHGYTWHDEFPIFLGICTVPIIVACLVWWKFS